MKLRAIARFCAAALSVGAALSTYACFAASPQQAGRADRRVACNRFAAPGGSDRHGHGTRHRPFRTISRLDRSLRAGQTGCVRAGSYGNLRSWQLIWRSGRTRQPITIRAYPGERVKLRGWIDITASHTVLSGFIIDGSNTLLPHGRCSSPVSAALSIDGEGDVVEHNDIYQSIPRLRSNGVSVGFGGDGSYSVIRFNRVHDVGQCGAYDHLIYLARGNHVRIYDNWLWNDPHGWGVQIYPTAAAAVVFGNVIDHAGSGITVGGSEVTSENTIFHNVIINSTGLPTARLRGVAISDYWERIAGTGNLFIANDSFHNPGGIAHVQAVRVLRNVAISPSFVNAAAHDYRVVAGSRLAKWGLWGG